MERWKDAAGGGGVVDGRVARQKGLGAEGRRVGVLVLEGEVGGVDGGV